MPFIMYDPTKVQAPFSPEPHLRVLAEGIRFTFLPFKAYQITEPQWRYMTHKGISKAGLVLFEINDDLMSEVMAARAAAAARRAALRGAPAPAPATPAAPTAAPDAPGPVDDAGGREPDPAPVVSTTSRGERLYQEALGLERFRDLQSFADEHLSVVPRSRQQILEALRALR